MAADTITAQWRDEILKHVDPALFKVKLYEGVKQEGFIRPEALAQYDIVITSYSVLSGEIYHLFGNEQRGSKRFQKK